MKVSTAEKLFWITVALGGLASVGAMILCIVKFFSATV